MVPAARSTRSVAAQARGSGRWRRRREERPRLSPRRRAGRSTRVEARSGASFRGRPAARHRLDARSLDCASLLGPGARRRAGPTPCSPLPELAKLAAQLEQPAPEPDQQLPEEFDAGHRDCAGDRLHDADEQVRHGRRPAATPMSGLPSIPVGSGCSAFRSHTSLVVGIGWESRPKVHQPIPPRSIGALPRTPNETHAQTFTRYHTSGVNRAGGTAAGGGSAANFEGTALDPRHFSRRAVTDHPDAVQPVERVCSSTPAPLAGDRDRACSWSVTTSPAAAPRPTRRAPARSRASPASPTPTSARPSRAGSG